METDGADEQRRQILMALGAALDEFRKLSHTMPVAQVQAFLMAALDDNLSMTEVASKAGLRVSTASRYLMDLGVPRHEHDSAFGLLRRGVDPKEPRRARYMLTRKGRKLVDALVTQLSLIETGGSIVNLPRSK